MLKGVYQRFKLLVTAAAPGDLAEAVRFPMAVPLLPFPVEEVFLPGEGCCHSRQ
jgi:hypothetical protein